MTDILVLDDPTPSQEQQELQLLGCLATEISIDYPTLPLEEVFKRATDIAERCRVETLQDTTSRAYYLELLGSTIRDQSQMLAILAGAVLTTLTGAQAGVTDVTPEPDKRGKRTKKKKRRKR